MKIDRPFGARLRSGHGGGHVAFLISREAKRPGRKGRPISQIYRADTYLAADASLASVRTTRCAREGSIHCLVNCRAELRFRWLQCSPD